VNRPSDRKARRINAFGGPLAAALLLGSGWAAADGANPFVPVNGAQFSSALPAAAGAMVRVPSFLLQSHPVTNAEFLSFVTAHQAWRRGAAPRVLADEDYLSHWLGPLDPGPGAGLEPVTRVSWFAAEAYCESLQARLPSWTEWELAAAASPERRDARADAAWRQHLLDWYAQPSDGRLAQVARGSANVYGLFDLYGLVWEWVEDFNSLLPADADPEKFCGSGAQNLQQKDNYALLMRIAMLGSLRGADTGHTLGFRCARDAREALP
jgi:formylglycine-generating enzyme required for sulfatase activity